MLLQGGSLDATCGGRLRFFVPEDVQYSTVNVVRNPCGGLGVSPGKFIYFRFFSVEHYQNCTPVDQSEEISQYHMKSAREGGWGVRARAAGSGCLRVRGG